MKNSKNAPERAKQKVETISKNTLRFAGVLFFWLALWQLAHAVTGRSVLLPSPAETVRALFRLCQTGVLLPAVGTSLLRMAIGYLLGALGGILLAVGTAASGLLRSLLHPLMVIMKTTPVASFIILAVVWLRTGSVPSFTIALIVAPIFWSNVYTGITSADRQLLEMARMYKFSRRTMLTKLYIPQVYPYFYSAVTVGIGMAWKAGVAAEVICNPGNSIGGGLYESKIYLETDTMFAWTLTVIILSIILERLVVGLLDRTAGRRYRLDKA